jgi:hypothetical protein
VQAVHRLVSQIWCSSSVTSFCDVRQYAILVHIFMQRCRALWKDWDFACENLGETAVGWAFRDFLRQDKLRLGKQVI